VSPERIIHEQKSETDLQSIFFRRLLEERILFISSACLIVHSVDQGGRPFITSAAADFLIGGLLYLESIDQEKDINLYIDSPGGDVSAGLAIYDTMQFIKSDVRTTCVGMAASMGAVLLAAGAPGKRSALPNAKIMMHQPWGGIQGQATDMRIAAEQIMKDRDRINEILSFHTGQPKDRIERDTDRDFWMTPDEAKEYGIVDEVLSPAEKKAKR